MDASKLIKLRMEAANTYKRFWQPRDASEVTQRNAGLAAAGNVRTHVGPAAQCCTDGSSRQNVGGNDQPGGFSTTYSYDVVRERVAGCTYCNDANYNDGRGITLKTCEEIAVITARPANPVKGRDLMCGKSTEVVQRGITGNCNVGPCPPAYTGWLNQVPK
jgi:hypothetical protein